VPLGREQQLALQSAVRRQRVGHPVQSRDDLGSLVQSTSHDHGKEQPRRRQLLGLGQVPEPQHDPFDHVGRGADEVDPRHDAGQGIGGDPRRQRVVTVDQLEQSRHGLALTTGTRLRGQSSQVVTPRIGCVGRHVSCPVVSRRCRTRFSNRRPCRP
jgi:hypothetical protein